MLQNYVAEFKQAIADSFMGMNLKTSWPLNPGQIDAYFDVEQALSIYFKLIELRKTKSIQEIADLMPSADVIRIAIENNLILGLKYADKLDICKISKEQRLNYFNLLCDILSYKVKNNIFCLDGKNILLSENEVKILLDQTNFDIPKDSFEKRKVASLAVMGNNLCYSLVYDLNQTFGFHLHGPYNVSDVFGDNSILVIRDYNNINLQEIWPNFKLKYKTLRFLLVYKNLDLTINYSNLPKSNSSVGDKLIAYKIYLDNNEINIGEIEFLIKEFNDATQEQVQRVNNLSNLDKVRKGAEIGFIQFKKLFEYFKEEPKPKYVEEVISKFGTKFIEDLKIEKQKDVDTYVRMLDPSDDFVE